MAQNNGGPNTHAVMHSSLAKALIESGVKHYDLGGLIGGLLTSNNGFHGELAPTTQSNYAPTIAQAQTNALAVNPQQQALAQQLLMQSQGGGPNPAQDALNQNTGVNVANQGALMAGQRGAGANVGLMARQIASQGANTQQQAAGQAATLGAQQQLGAQQNLQNLYGQEQEGANSLLNTAAGAQTAQNNTSVNNYAQMQGINSGVAAGNTAAVNNVVGGLINGGAAAGAAYLKGKAAAADGGKVIGDGNIKSPTGNDPQVLTGGGSVPGKSPHPGNDIRNDTQLALLSKGEVVLPQSVTQSSDPAKKAAEFMKHLKGGKSDDASGYDKVVQSKKSLKDRIEHLEKLCMGGKV